MWSCLSDHARICLQAATASRGKAQIVRGALGSNSSSEYSEKDKNLEREAVGDVSVDSDNIDMMFYDDMLSSPAALFPLL